jgi:circadian clock protein KaiB
MKKPSHLNGNGTGKADVFKFRLYIAGDAPNSLLAVANLNALCNEHLPNRHEIETVDVMLDPKRALADGILLTPTLIKFLPEPVRKIIGTLIPLKNTLHLLGLPASTDSI